MAAYQTKIACAGPAFEKNRSDMLALIDRLREIESRAVQASNKRRPTFEKRGQIPPHERLSRILDPGMPFLQLHSLANYLVEDDDPDTSVPGASIIAGIGFVSGVRCLLWVDDSGIRAGSMTQMTMPMGLSIEDIALRQNLPLIHLVESAGANLMNFTVESWAGSGGIFRNLARLSAKGVPTLVVLHGPSTAGGAYMPGMSDYVIGVKKNGLAALAGAALVRAATGEIADDRELGGSEMHASVSGLVEYLAEDDAHGLSIARDIVGRLDWNKNAPAFAEKSYRPPVYDPDELAGVVPVDYKSPYDAREVIARIVDGSEFDEFKPRFGAATVCVHASIMGHACNIIGNNGPIDPDGAAKATQFFQLSDQSETPVVFLHNTTGYIVGTTSEQAGMIKLGAKMIQAVSNIRVPRISLYIGASFGAGNYGMCGYAYQPDFLFAWPNASTNVMGHESAAKTMRQVTEASAQRKGEPIDEKALNAQQSKIEAHFKRQENAFYTSGRLLDHGVIDPRDTRKVLGFCLETCLEARSRKLQPNSFGVARI
ncbi:MAG: carboxyl transferase domain-containing protein [Pseudomonadota bacterium]